MSLLKKDDEHPGSKKRKYDNKYKKFDHRMKLCISQPNRA